LARSEDAVGGAGDESLVIAETGIVRGNTGAEIRGGQTCQGTSWVFLVRRNQNREKIKVIRTRERRVLGDGRGDGGGEGKEGKDDTHYERVIGRNENDSGSNSGELRNEIEPDLSFYTADTSLKRG
jgi:hypothetical protein